MILSSVFPLMIKDNLVLIFGLTFSAFVILTFQRLYIHFNHISIFQLFFVRLQSRQRRENSFPCLSVHLLHYGNISSLTRCCVRQTTVTLS